MLRHRLTFLLALLFVGINQMNAQEARGVCGNTYEHQMSQIDRYMTNKKIAKTNPSSSRNATTYVPIQFNIVTKSNGSGQIQLTDLMEQMCRLNEQYGKFDIKFFMQDEVKFFNSDIIYDNHTATSAQFTMRTQRNREALNVWITNNATPNGGPSIGTVLGYYDTQYDWIVMKKNQITAMNNTLAHELGHFFSLFHPHLGWDSENYSIEDHGNPVKATAPNGTSTELQDRSNCETAGDMLCDTPPDYNFALTWNDCNFNVDIKDPNGDLVDPDETLIMSYFADECTSNFSPTQVEMMIADVASPQRNFLRQETYSPAVEEITAEPRLLAPINDAVTSTYNKVYLKWEAVPGATSYLLEVDRSSGFNIDNFKFFTNETTFLLDELLDDNRTYRWRITPFNKSYTCAPSSEAAKFKTGVSTSIQTIETVDNWSIQPNPSQANSTISINVNAKKGFKADLKIYNLTGQIVKSSGSTDFSIGVSTLQIDTKNLTKGIYFVTLENQEGVLNKKLVIQ